MVIPLPNTATPGRCMPEASNILISRDRPLCTGPQIALAKLAVAWLQRRFAALPRTGTQRLNTIYTVAGLIKTCIFISYFTCNMVNAANSTQLELDTALQQVKREMIELDEKIHRIDRNQPRLETVSVYISVDKDILFQLEKIRLKLDGKTVSETVFYNTQQQALKLGGAAPVYKGTLMQGKHRFEATFIGTGKNGKRVEHRKQWSLAQPPGQHSMVELHLGNSTFSQTPSIDMRVVD